MALPQRLTQATIVDRLWQEEPYKRADHLSPGFTLVETLEKGTQCISTFVEKEVKIMERTALLIVVLVAALSLVEARKFCPKERNGDKCKAKK